MCVARSLCTSGWRWPRGAPQSVPVHTLPYLTFLYPAVEKFVQGIVTHQKEARRKEGTKLL